MEQKLNIKLLEEQNGYLKAVDSTSIPADNYNKINRAFIEFVVKDNSIIFNIVKEVIDAVDFSPSTIINIEFIKLSLKLLFLGIRSYYYHYY